MPLEMKSYLSQEDPNDRLVKNCSISNLSFFRAVNLSTLQFVLWSSAFDSD
jgi:hypothetical protein